MRSLWDADCKFGGLDAQLHVRVRQCPGGLSVSARCRFSGRLICARYLPWDGFPDLIENERRVIMASIFKRPEGTGAGGKPTGKPEDERMRKKFPVLFDFLCEDLWPDGELRERSTVIMFVEGGQFKACLSDKATGMCLWATAGDFASLWDTLEARLGEDKPDWRASKTKKK